MEQMELLGLVGQEELPQQEEGMAGREVMVLLALRGLFLVVRVEERELRLEALLVEQELEAKLF